MDANDLAGLWVAKEYGTGGAGLVLILLFFFSQCSGDHRRSSQTHPKQTHHQTLHPATSHPHPYALRSL
jgi:hypothetical protein